MGKNNSAGCISSTRDDKDSLLIKSATAVVVVAMLGAIIVAVSVVSAPPAAVVHSSSRLSSVGVCPPFHLLDQEGRVIDPIKKINSDQPYSPAKTCGKCHHYARITYGYHFQQGAGEKPTADQASRCAWVTSPGNYGGTWCSPAPLYRQLAAKNNQNARSIDMTSYDFIVAGCARCHPGGGPVEYDRAGKRYDKWMKDPASGFSCGGNNRFDGDYFKARWSKTGVLEADCLLCHLPEYRFSERSRQIGLLNFRWAATAGAGLGQINGSVKNKQPVTVVYNQSAFNTDGTLSPHIVREPRNSACLSCHSQPGWKKRGANFRQRTDVHLRAGLRCVDCHPAGMSAEDKRIHGKELHQFGKGDDPGGHVRDDLDNTCRDCNDCHSNGHLGAPVAKHRWLPPLHLDKIACQTCHIPQRTVKAAQVQAADVFNPGAKIPSKNKHLWTFYGPDMKYWNYYGDLEMMGADDKPTAAFRPVLARYKAKIYPVNRIHSAWPAIEVPGKSALLQPQMGVIYKMWQAHRQDASKYPELGKIKDDDRDGIPEVNTPQEIEAIIAAVSKLLNDTGYPLQGKKVVWVLNDRIYSSGKQYRSIPKHSWEASPYANVHKYNHDVYPANSALGINGCTDCHHLDSAFFFQPVLQYPFDPATGQPAYQPQYQVLDYAKIWAVIGAWREMYLKPVLYAMIIAWLAAASVLIGQMLLDAISLKRQSAFLKLGPWLIGSAIGISALLLTLMPNIMAYMLPGRFWLDSNHFSVSIMIIILGVLPLSLRIMARKSEASSPAGRITLLILLLICASGLLMLIRRPETLTRLAYTTFDIGLLALLIVSLIISVRQAITKTCN